MGAYFFILLFSSLHYIVSAPRVQPGHVETRDSSHQCHSIPNPGKRVHTKLASFRKPHSFELFCRCSHTHNERLFHSVSLWGFSFFPQRSYQLENTQSPTGSETRLNIYHHDQTMIKTRVLGACRTTSATALCNSLESGPTGPRTLS